MTARTGARTRKWADFANDDGREYRWKEIPTPRPLDRLNGLARRADWLVSLWIGNLSEKKTQPISTR
ncbi:hypothetical protein CCP2SC5_30075 [Azospirillaceae bacterium]